MHRARASDTKTTDGVFRWGKPGKLSARKPSDDTPLHSKNPKGTDMKKLLAIAAASLAATPALAHHPLGGLPMETFAHGALSGVGHPVLGFDHMFFVIAMGVAALFTAHRYLTPAAYIAAMLVGCGLMYAGVAMPLQETFIAISLLAVGGIVLSGRALGVGTALAVFAAFGLFHGSAFGGSIAAQEGGIGAGVVPPVPGPSSTTVRASPASMTRLMRRSRKRELGTSDATSLGRAMNPRRNARRSPISATLMSPLIAVRPQGIVAP